MNAQRWRRLGRRVLAACAVVGPLVACGAVVQPVVDLVENSLVDALVNQLAPGVNRAIVDLEANATVVADAKMLAYALPWAQRAVDYLGPRVGLTPAQVAAADVAVQRAEADLARPPTTLAAALREAVAAYRAVVAALRPALAK